MRISDWSSDVCSSDLERLAGRIQTCTGGGQFGFRFPRSRIVAPRRLHGGLQWLRGQRNRSRWGGNDRGVLKDGVGGLRGNSHGRHGDERSGRCESQKHGERKSVVEGKGLSVSVDIGGCRIIKKKKKTRTKN